MNYEIIQTNENGKFYSIKETETDHIIATFKKSVDAKKQRIGIDRRKRWGSACPCFI